MNEPHYVLYADQPLHQRVPWWVWALGLVAVVLLVVRPGRAKDGKFEDYLR